MIIKELKDILTIYQDCEDYTIELWNPDEYKKYELIFTGSSNVNKMLNFNIRQKDLTDVEKRRLKINMELLMLYKQESIIKKRIETLEKQ